MEDLLKEILKELRAINEKLDSISGNIVSYSSDDTASEILEVVKQIKSKV